MSAPRAPIFADTTHSRGFRRFHLSDRQALMVESVDGPETLGRGWLVVFEAEHQAFVGLLSAARAVLPILQRDLDATISAHCLLTPDLQPRIETLDAVALPIVAELRTAIDALEAAIGQAEGGT